MATNLEKKSAECSVPPSLCSSAHRVNLSMTCATPSLFLACRRGQPFQIPLQHCHVFTKTKVEVNHRVRIPSKLFKTTVYHTPCINFHLHLQIKKSTSCQCCRKWVKEFTQGGFSLWLTLMFFFYNEGSKKVFKYCLVCTPSICPAHTNLSMNWTTFEVFQATQWSSRDHTEYHWTWESMIISEP